MDLSEATSFAGRHRRSVMVTMRADGRPQLTNVVHHLDGAGVARVSITRGQVKHRNLLREPWAALHVSAEDFSAYAVIEGDVELSPPAGSTDDDTVEELVRLYRDLAGEHPDWAEYRRAMVDDGRLVVRLHPRRAYGMLPPG